MHSLPLLVIVLRMSGMLRLGTLFVASKDTWGK